MDISALCMCDYQFTQFAFIFIKNQSKSISRIFLSKTNEEKENTKLIFMSMLIKNEAHVNLRNASHSDRQRWKRIYIVDWTKIYV